jgi:MFS family permease
MSGIGSDVLVKRLHASRYWCTTISGSIFAIAQVAAMNIENPNYLWIVSLLTGLAYGFLFGVFPALVADAFGFAGFAVNWGVITLAPVVSGNIFNLCYGAIFDSHSVIDEKGESVCKEGLICYSHAYVVTLVSSVAGILVSMWGVHHQHAIKQRIKEWEDDHDA